MPDRAALLSAAIPWAAHLDSALADRTSAQMIGAVAAALFDCADVGTGILTVSYSRSRHDMVGGTAAGMGRGLRAWLQHDYNCTRPGFRKRNPLTHDPDRFGDHGKIFHRASGSDGRRRDMELAGSVALAIHAPYPAQRRYLEHLKIAGAWVWSVPKDQRYSRR